MTNKPHKICWQKSWECFDYGWDDERKTGMIRNPVSLSISLFGYWIGLDYLRYDKLGFLDRLIKKVSPFYLRFWPSFYWIAWWSAPTTPTKKDDYWKALRITIRYGKHNELMIKELKKGYAGR